jgi:hypothetical protein
MGDFKIPLNYEKNELLENCHWRAIFPVLPHCDWPLAVFHHRGMTPSTPQHSFSI